MTPLETLNALISTAAACDDYSMRIVIEKCIADISYKVVDDERTKYVKALEEEKKRNLIERCNSFTRDEYSSPKIAAVKLVRDELGLSLVDAKHWVEANTIHVAIPACTL